MSDIANPYIAGSPVTGKEMFFGRQDVFDFIKKALTGMHRDHVLVLYGQRRTGKTSVLYQMHRHLEPRYLCVFIDLHGLALNGLDGFIWEFASHISRSLRRDYQIQAPLPGRVDFLADPRQNFEAVFLEGLWPAIGDRHVLLMLDEAVRLEEQVRAGRLEPEIFEYLRHLMQHYPRLNFLFSLGSGLEEMEKEYAFLFNVALYKKISFLDHQSAIDLITQPVKSQYQLEPEAVERIIRITSAHPYFIQLICHSLFNYYHTRPISTVKVHDVEAVLDETVERGLAVLKYVWEESTPVEKAVLAGLAGAIGEQGGFASSDQIRALWVNQGVAIPEGEIAKAIKSLISRDVIAGEGLYKFTVDLQRLWVQKYRRLEWAREEIGSTARQWTQEEVAPRPAVGIPWWRRRGRVPLLIVLAGVILIGVAFAYNSLFGLPSIIPRPSATMPLTQVSGSDGGVVPGGDATLVNDLEALGDYVWAGTDGGLVRWRVFEAGQPVDALLVHGFQVGLPDDCINTVTAGPEGDLWLGCGGLAWIRPEGDSIVSLGYFNRDDGLNMGVVKSVVVDGQGWIWAGGNYREGDDPPLNYYDGRDHPDDNPWQNQADLNQAWMDMAVDQDVTSLLASQDGSLWIGLNDGSVLRWDGSNLEQYPLKEPPPRGGPNRDLWVRDLIQDREGRLWAAANEKGLFRYAEASNSWTPVEIEAINQDINSITQISDGSLWVGSDQLVAMSRDGGSTWRLAGEGLGNGIAGLVEDSLGNVWAGSYGEGVSVYQEGAWLALQR